MTFDEAKTRYRDCPALTQAKILARYAFLLTILARETYEVGKEGVLDPVVLRKLNETMHRVTAHICSLLTDSQDRYPDTVLLDIITGRKGPEGLFAEAASTVIGNEK